MTINNNTTENAATLNAAAAICRADRLGSLIRGVQAVFCYRSYPGISPGPYIRQGGL